MMSLKGVAIGAAAPDLAAVRQRSAVAQAMRSILGRHLNGVPDEPLLPEQRSTRGGALFPAGPVFIDVLTQDVLAAPGWYPELQERAVYLAARQEEASSWEALRGVLMFALDLVSDLHITAQEECNREGLAMVKRIEDGLKVAAGEERERALDRLYGIDRARVVLREYRDEAQRKRRRAEPKEGAPPTPRQQARRQRRREVITMELYGAFRKVLRDWAAKGGPR
jgi:hypothetical protein